MRQMVGALTVDHTVSFFFSLIIVLAVSRDRFAWHINSTCKAFNGETVHSTTKEQYPYINHHSSQWRLTWLTVAPLSVCV